MAYYIPPPEKVGGHVPRVPHHIAPMLLVRYNADLELRSFCYTVAGVSNLFSLWAISALCLPVKGQL